MIITLEGADLDVKSPKLYLPVELLSELLRHQLTLLYYHLDRHWHSQECAG